MSLEEDLPRATISSEVLGIAYIPCQVGADFVHSSIKDVFKATA
jgi:hypothetical protein